LISTSDRIIGAQLHHNILLRAGSIRKDHGVHDLIIDTWTMSVLVVDPRPASPYGRRREDVAAFKAGF